MEIDKVVEAARAYVECTFNKEITCDVLKERDKLLIALKDALNPPPSRPSKETCIEWLERFGSKEDKGNTLGLSDSVQLVFLATVEYLKEPSLQWVKNTGVMPEYKVCIVKYNRGAVKLLENIDPAIWQIDEEDPVWDIKEYIILE